MERLTFTDEELWRIGTDCPVKNDYHIDQFCDNVCDEFQNNCPFMKLAQKLKEYEDKQEQGLLKILPCPIGTLVHEPYKFLGDGAWEIDHHYLKLEDLDKIGKTVFVDENDAKAYIEKAEAEEALAKMGGK